MRYLQCVCVCLRAYANVSDLYFGLSIDPHGDAVVH